MSSLNIDRFEQYIAERRLIANAYLDTDARGRELACFYAALAPDEADRTDPGACPAEAMPAWLAHLLPWLDDSARDDEERYARARRLAPILRRVGDPQYQEALRRADYACRAVAVREARAHATGAAVLAAIDGALALLDRAAAGETVDAEKWEEVARVAWVRAVAARAARAAVEAVEAVWAAVAARAAARAAAVAVEAAWASEAAEAAAWASEAAAVAAVEAVEAVEARAAASARIADGMLTALEAAVGLREAA